MSTNKQALRGQSVDANFYLAECCNCGQVMPSSKLIESRNYPDGDADCHCPHCNADDCDINDMGSAASEAWNYQQKRIEAMLDELEAAEKRIAEQNFENLLLANADRDIKALRQRIAELESRTVTLPPRAPENMAACLDGYDKWVIATTFRDTWNACLSEVMRMNAAGIGVKGE